jgi:hypothetical protein
LRLPTIEIDYWELRSAERSHAENPTKFQIPSADARNSLARGDAAKLIFDIEACDESGQLVVGGERMWVIVSERIGDYYIGILDSKPSLDASDDVYLVFGAEVPFLPEHVIDIAHPPKQYQDWQLSQPPERQWPRP